MIVWARWDIADANSSSFHWCMRIEHKSEILIQQSSCPSTHFSISNSKKKKSQRWSHALVAFIILHFPSATLIADSIRMPLHGIIYDFLINYVFSHGKHYFQTLLCLHVFYPHAFYTSLGQNIWICDGARCETQASCHCYPTPAPIVNLFIVGKVTMRFSPINYVIPAITMNR